MDPAPSTLSRLLAAFPPEPVEALRTRFLEDVLARPLNTEKQPGGLWDRQASHWLVFDVDGTREPARVSRLAPDGGSACTTASLASPRCSRLHRTPTRGGRAYSNHHPASPYPSVARLVRQRWQRSVPRGTTPGGGHNSAPRQGSCTARGTDSLVAGREVRDWSHPCRTGRTSLRDAWQRLSAPRPESASRHAYTCLPISSSAALKVTSCAPSTTALT